MDQAKTRMSQYSMLSECEWRVKLTNFYAISFTYAPLQCLHRRRKILLSIEVDRVLNEHISMCA